jgi:uncharacterized protein
MWNKVAEAIIKNRLLLSIIIGAITIVMGYYAARVEMSYEFARTVPPNDPDQIYLDNFKAQFGEDANIIAVGMKDSAVYSLDNFKAYRDLIKDVKTINGVTNVLALPVLKMILKDTAHSKFYLAEIFNDTISTQKNLDSLLALALDQKLYESQLVNASNGATMMLVSV